jgi:hypothetical protein
MHAHYSSASPGNWPGRGVAVAVTSGRPMPLRVARCLLQRAWRPDPTMRSRHGAEHCVAPPRCRRGRSKPRIPLWQLLVLQQISLAIPASVCAPSCSAPLRRLAICRAMAPVSHVGQCTDCMLVAAARQSMLVCRCPNTVSSNIPTRAHMDVYAHAQPQAERARF